MATWAIGDVQGCWQSLQALLEAIHYDPADDELLFAGDLVNRGPGSLEVLRFAMDQEARVVLGNHDLHLLACDAGVRQPRPGDTLDGILTAPDRDRLLDWLGRQPLLIEWDGYVLVHAGLLPAWTQDAAARWADRIRAALMGPERDRLLARPRGETRLAWNPRADERSRLRVALAAFTLLRTCTPAGEIDLKYKGPPGQAPAGSVPWYAVPSARWRENGRRTTVLFGHWAAHGFADLGRVVCLDSGCVWGGALTAFRLEDRRVVQVPSRDVPAPRTSRGTPS